MTIKITQFTFNFDPIAAIYYQLATKHLMRTKAPSRLLPATAAPSSSSSSAAAVKPVLLSSAPPTTMPDFEMQLAQLQQELRDLTASPPPMGPSLEEQASFHKEHDEAVAGANKMHKEWFGSFAVDYVKKNTLLKEALKAAISEVETDEEERIEAELKKLRTDAKAAKLAKKAETDKAVQIIGDALRRNLNSYTSTAMDAHKAELAAKAKEIAEAEARLYEIKRQRLRCEYQTMVSKAAEDLMKSLDKLDEFHSRYDDCKDVIMDDGTAIALQKYARNTALHVAQRIEKRFPKFKPTNVRAMAMETVNLVEEGDNEEDEEEAKARPKISMEFKKGKRKRREEPSDTAASPGSGTSSASSSRRRPNGAGFRKQKVFSTGISGGSSSSAAAASSSLGSSRDRVRS